MTQTPEKRRALRAANPTKYRDREDRYRKANPEKTRLKARVRNWRKLKLPTPTHPCPSTCECCGRPPSSKQALHLDHCHVSGVFRGWLCSECNRAIGKLGDSIEGLMNAVRYLERAAEVKT
jgi:hypothetical protein